MRAAHCLSILSQFVNVRIMLESINGQSQRADCVCTVHAMGISVLAATSMGVQWCVCMDALGIRTMWSRVHRVLTFVYNRISDAVNLKSVLACQELV